MFTAHIASWMYDADTADWLATDDQWLAVQYEDAKNLARSAGKTPTGNVTLVNYTQTGVDNDGLIYDFEFAVSVQ